MEILRKEINRLMEKEGLFDIIVTPEAGKGSHCISCPECGYYSIRIVGKKIQENGDVVNTVATSHFPKDLSELVDCKTNRKSILVDLNPLIPSSKRR